jgi:putative transposase
VGVPPEGTEAGLAPSVGAVGAPFDNAMVEALWARIQVELLNRKRWKTRVEARRRDPRLHRDLAQHPQTPRRLNMLTPTEYEDQHQQPEIAA